MKRIKNFLLLMSLLIISVKGFSQFPPFALPVQMNQCYTADSIVPAGYYLDSIQMLISPIHGTLDTTPPPFTYCPDSNFVGQDTMRIYACIMNAGLLLVCDTFDIIFDVQFPCSLSATLVQDSGICIGGNRSFAVVPSGGAGPYTYDWSDGSVASSACEPSPGQNICVTVTDVNGCVAAACSNNGCTTWVQIAQNICGGPLPSMEATGNGGTAPYTYTWSNGHTAAVNCNLTQGTYCVTVVDINGCSATACATTSGCQQLACTIYYGTSMCSTSLIVGVQGGTGSYTYLWSDGSSNSYICNPVSGTYCVTVTDATGCTGQACYNTACPLSLSITTNQCHGPWANVSGGSPPYSYIWSNGDTSELLCNLPSGIYCVTATDALGCTISSCFTMPGPDACFFTYYLYQPTSAVTFAPSFDSAQTPAIQIWDFGDGTPLYPISGVGSPGHQYASSGYYYVCMNVLYSSGDSCSYCEYIYIPQDSTNYYCQAYFYNWIDTGNSNSFYFFDYSVYNPVSWAWDFGDGITSTLRNPAHTYATQGNWTVCLTTTDASGCSSSYCQQVSNIPVQDLQAYLYHGSNIVPGFPFYAYLGYYNNGNTLMYGTLEYRYPAGVTFDTSSVPPVSHDAANRLLTFNFGLLPGTADYIYVFFEVSPTLALGTLVYDTLWVNPISGDIAPVDNVSFVTSVVSGSFDPNDKAVSPKGLGATGDVPLTTSELSYLIRFQNTGTASAQTVVIRDALSNNIDLTSVRVTDESHQHITEIIGSELVITFHNINLPDSGADYEASQGYIQVHAKLKPGLTDGTQILNTAEIYFDFNAPVVTNTVTNTLRSDDVGIGTFESFDFVVMPNPANSQILLHGEFERGSVYELFNAVGQRVLTGEIKSNNVPVNISELSAAVYLVKITSEGKSGVQRLVVTK